VLSVSRGCPGSRTAKSNMNWLPFRSRTLRCAMGVCDRETRLNFAACCRRWSSSRPVTLWVKAWAWTASTTWFPGCVALPSGATQCCLAWRGDSNRWHFAGRKALKLLHLIYAGCFTSEIALFASGTDPSRVQAELQRRSGSVYAETSVVTKFLPAMHVLQWAAGWQLRGASADRRVTPRLFEMNLSVVRSSRSSRACTPASDSCASWCPSTPGRSGRCTISSAPDGRFAAHRAPSTRRIAASRPC